MKIVSVFFFCLATIRSITIFRASADDLPHMWSDARAIFDNAYRYTDDSDYSQWSIERLFKAEKSFAECQRRATTNHVLAFGDFGRMKSFIDIGIYGSVSARYAKIYARGNDAKGRRDFAGFR